MTITREHKTAWLATFAAVLVAVLFLHVGAGLGNTVGATLITYIATVVTVAVKIPLEPGKVVKATGRGAVMTAVIVVLLLTSFGRSLAAVMS